jgi:hypothetical protein
LRIKERADEATSALAAAKEEIKSNLIEIGQKRLRGDGWGVSWSTVKGKKSLDKQKMIAAGLDPDDYMTEGAAYDRLVVTPKEADDSVLTI